MKLYKITNISHRKEKQTVYDFTVKEDHSYVANSIVVHNSHCSTRIVTGHGIPQLSAIMSIRAKSNYPNHIIADGGIKTSGDIVKALAAGANSVMVGNLFAGTDESPGKLITGQNGNMYKQYRGQASKAFMDEHRRTTVAAEGVASFIPYKGPLETILHELVMGLKSGMSYSGVTWVQDLIQAKAVLITQNSWVESIPHGLLDHGVIQ